MRRVIHKHERLRSGLDPNSLFELNRVHKINRKPLLFSLADRLMSAETERKLSARQPIFTLWELPVKRQIHFTKKPLEERRAQFCSVIEEAITCCRRSAHTRIERGDFSFPSGVEKICIGFKLPRVYEIRIVGDQEQRRPDVD